MEMLGSKMEETELHLLLPAQLNSGQHLSLSRTLRYPKEGPFPCKATLNLSTNKQHPCLVGVTIYKVPSLYLDTYVSNLLKLDFCPQIISFQDYAPTQNLLVLEEHGGTLHDLVTRKRKIFFKEIGDTTTSTYGYSKYSRAIIFQLLEGYQCLVQNKISFYGGGNLKNIVFRSTEEETNAIPKLIEIWDTDTSKWTENFARLAKLLESISSQEYKFNSYVTDFLNFLEEKNPRPTLRMLQNHPALWPSRSTEMFLVFAMRRFDADPFISQDLNSKLVIAASDWEERLKTDINLYGFFVEIPSYRGVGYEWDTYEPSAKGLCRFMRDFYYCYHDDELDNEPLSNSQKNDKFRSLFPEFIPQLYRELLKHDGNPWGGAQFIAF